MPLRTNTFLTPGSARSRQDEEKEPLKAYLLQLLNEKYGVRECYYGHIHGKGCFSAFNGVKNSVSFRLVSADYVNFSPILVRD